MIVMIRAYVVARRAIAVTQLGDGIAFDERFQIIVDGCEADSRQFALDGEKDFIGSRMMLDTAQIIEHGDALLRQMPAARFKLLAQRFRAVSSLISSLHALILTRENNSYFN